MVGDFPVYMRRKEAGNLIVISALIRRATTYARFTLYKNHVFKNVEAQKYLFLKNIEVILLVAISIPMSLNPPDEI